MREGEAPRKGRRQTNVSSEREALFRAYYAPLFAFAQSQVDSVEKAKSIAASAFEAVGEVPGSAPPLEPRILLFTSARLAIEKEQRLSGRHLANVPQGSAQARPPEGRAMVLACVRQLTRREQGVLSLRFDGGLPCSEIALVMGMSEAEVMVMVLRALRRIKACMDRRRQAGTGAAGSRGSVP